MSINRAIVSGNLTRDPELRATPGGTQVLGFGIAVNDRRRNQQTGEWEDYPNFIDCTMFGNRAEALSRILRKGMKVVVEGKLRYSAWEDRDGGKRSKLEVIVDEIEFMSSRQHAEQGNPPYVAERPQVYATQPAPKWSAQEAYRNPPATTPQRPQAPAPQAHAPQQAPQPVQPELYDEDIPF